MSDYTFTKLFNSITKSTVWCEPHTTLRVWITMLADCNRDGEVHASIPGLANLARVTVPECESAITTFLSPDPYSRTPDHEGRRIEVIPGGWRLLNHAHYRDKRDDGARRDQNREAQRRHRQQASAETLTNADIADGQQKSANASAHTDTDTDTYKKQSKDLVQPAAAPCRFEDFWRAYPNKKGKQEAEKTWKRRKLDEHYAELVAHVYLMSESDDAWIRGYVPMGSTYLNQARWEDVPQRPPEAGPRAGAQQGKQVQALMGLEGLKHVAANGNRDGAPETLLALTGPHSGR